MADFISNLHTAIDTVFHHHKASPSVPTNYESDDDFGLDENDDSHGLDKNDDNNGRLAKNHQNGESDDSHGIGKSDDSHGHPLVKNRENLERLWKSFKRPLKEQEYARHVDINIVDVEPTQDELNKIAVAGKRLWALDLNRLEPGHDYEINVGHGKSVNQRWDRAWKNLFTRVNANVLKKPTYARFQALLNNYRANQLLTEHETEEYQQEQIAFIEEISRSAPIMYLRKYLIAKKIVSGSFTEFKNKLKSFWFDFYDRGGGHNSSSAFEHIFVGEIRNGYIVEVKGFHNWIKFYEEEVAHRLNYRGYIHSSIKPNARTQCFNVQFKWNGGIKRQSSIFVGVSPEFELALYTLCFYGGKENNYMTLDSYNLNIKCSHLPADNNKMASCYAQVL